MFLVLTNSETIPDNVDDDVKVRSQESGEN